MPSAPTTPHRIAPTTARPTTQPMSQRLDREWAQMGRRPALVETVRTWELEPDGTPPVTSLDDLLRLTGFRCPATQTTNDTFRRLLTIAAHDPLAARIALQRILPGLLAIVAAEQRRAVGIDAFDVLLAEAWVSIVSYPTATRESDVAARLLHDARHRAFTNPRRRRRVGETLCAPHRVAEPAHPAERSSFEELTTLLGSARDDGLPARDIEVMAGIVNHGSSARLATVLRMDQRSVRYRRDQAVRRVRQILRDPQLLPVGPRSSRAPAGR